MAFGGVIKLVGGKEYRQEIQNIKKNVEQLGDALTGSAKDFDKMDSAAGKSSRATDKIGDNAKKAAQNVKKLSAEYSAQSAKVVRVTAVKRDLEKELRNEEKTLRQIEKELGSTSKEYQEQKEKVDKLATEVAQATAKEREEKKALKDLGKALNEAEKAADGTEEEFDQLNSELDQSDNSTRRAGDGFTVLKGIIANLATDVLRKAIDGVKEFVKSTLTLGIDFEKQMSKVGAISGATGEELNSLNKKAKELGKNTVFSATEAAQGMEYMAMAGWSTEQMLSGLAGVLNLAAASGEDLANVSDIVTDALTAFGLQAKDSGRFADVLAAASSNANTNVGMLGASFQNVAPVAGALKYSIEDVSLALGLMANAGIKGEKAGTSLRALLSRMASPTKAVYNEMKSLGVSLTDAKGEMLPFGKVLDNLRTAFGKLSEAEKAESASVLAGKEAMAGLLAVVNASPKDYKKLTDAINNSGGAAKSMSEEMQNNVSGSLTALKNKFDDIKLNLFDKLAPDIKKAMEDLSKGLESVNWDGVTSKIRDIALAIKDGFQWLLDNWSLIVSGITAIGVAMLGLQVTQTITAMVEAWKAYKLAQEGATIAQWAYNAAIGANPIGAIISLIAALVAGIIVLWNTNEDFRNAVTNIWNGVLEAIKPVIDALGEAFKWICDEIFPLFKPAIDAICKLFKGDLKGALASIWEYMTGWWAKIWEWVKKIPELIIAYMKWGWGNILSFLGNVGSGLINWVTTKVSEFVNKFVNFIKSLPEKTGYWLGFVLGKITSFGVSMINWVATKVPEFISKFINFVKELPGKVWTWLSNTLVKLTNFGSQMVSKGASAGTNFVTKLTNFIKELPGRIGNILSSTISRVSNFATQMGSKALQAGRQFATNIINAIKSLPGRLQSIGGNIVQGLWNGIKNMAGWLKGQIAGFAKSVVSGFMDSFKIKSPSRVMRDLVGKNLALGIGVGFTDEMDHVRKDMVDAVPTDFDVNANFNTGYQSREAMILNSLLDALKNVKIVMDGREMGHFVDKTVTQLVYS